MEKRIIIFIWTIIFSVIFICLGYKITSNNTHIISSYDSEEELDLLTMVKVISIE